ncbi:putative RNA-directed DNA polymerase from transposon X-element, partial [Diplonema papillatum]
MWTCGPDGINNLMLINLGTQARDTLLRLLNLSYTKGVVPFTWREAHMMMLLKPGKSADQPDAYRPIALTSCVAKLLERLVHCRLSCHLEGKLHPTQAGFQKGRSAEEQIATVQLTLQAARDSGKRSVLLLFDITKAFDRVVKSILTKELQKKGVSGRMLRWICEFLRKRRAAVKVNDSLGRFYDLEKGVPQGTVLAPLLFLCYIDSLAAKLNSIFPEITLSLFADDLAVVLSSSDLSRLREQAQAVVNAIDDWAAEFALDISYEKTKLMYVPTTADVDIEKID